MVLLIVFLANPLWLLFQLYYVGIFSLIKLLKVAANFSAFNLIVTLSPRLAMELATPLIIQLKAGRPIKQFLAFGTICISINMLSAYSIYCGVYFHFLVGLCLI